MSLINEALKKAQRLRNDPQAQADAAPSSEGDIRIAKRRQARSANTMVLLGAGALVLVVLSVVATVYLVNQPGATPVAAEPHRPASTTTTDTTPAPLPSVVAPVLPTPTPPVPAAASETAAANAGKNVTPPSGETPAPAASAVAASQVANAAEPVSGRAPASSNPAVTRAATPISPASGPPKPDERVIAFVDAVRVAGIRSSGAESRVLMNDRVYRVNDIVDRSLEVRLVAVATDSLTFADANGVEYVKHF